jgi:4-hydroxy-tetrahydrodipicolinate reductase
MSIPISVVVHGAGGRMGQAVLQALGACADMRVVAALVRSGSRLEGTRVCAKPGVPSGADLVHVSSLSRELAADVMIDFSHADAFDNALALALDRRSGFVSGSTGLDALQRVALARAAESIPVLWSANFSLGVALLSRLVAEAARALPDWDCEIAEAHHRGKQDAPSGTALALGREVATARVQGFDEVAKLRGNAPREPGSIGFAVTRAGDIVGEHTVLLAGEGERIELTHRATDRSIFARGAVSAARWLAGRAPGHYTLADMLAVASSQANPR